MVRTKRFYILMIKVNKLIFFFALFYFLKEIESMFSVFLSTNKNTRETLAKAVETLACGLILPTALLIFPNFHLCFYNLIETWYMFSIS